MVPGNAIIVKTNGTDGASVDHYALNDKRTSQVITPSAWTVTDMRVRTSTQPHLPRAGGKWVEHISLNLIVFSSARIAIKGEDEHL